MPHVIGIDLSIACTGVARFVTTDASSRGWTALIPTKGYVKKKKKNPIQEEQKRLINHHERISKIISSILDYARFCDLVVMEGLSFNSYDTNKQNAGLAWIVRHHLHRLAIPYALVPASNLKRYATGNGAATKQDVIGAVESWSPGIMDDHPEELRNNAADAAVLAAMGHTWLGLPMGTINPGDPAAVDKCLWPCDRNTVA